MPGKEEFSIGGLILLVIILAALFGGGDNSANTQSPVSSDAETWRNYISSPLNEDVLVNLENSQKLIIALGNDLSRVQAQNVDTQYALQTVAAQLAQIQQQAAEDAKRQTRENWMFAIMGIIGGWLVNFIFPTENLISFVEKFLEKRKSKKNRLTVNNVPASRVEEIAASKEAKPENVALSRFKTIINASSDAVDLSSSRRCPKCSYQMKIGPALQGEFKNTFVYACPNCHEIIPFK